MKRLIIFVGTMLFLAGCGGTSGSGTSASPSTAATSPSTAPAEPNTMAVGTNIEVDFPADWKDIASQSAFDVHRESAIEDMVTGIFLYGSEDVSDDAVPADIMDMVAEDLMAKRENDKFIETVQDETTGGMYIKTDLYEADASATKTYYLFSVVEFDEHDEFIVFVQTCFPSDWPDESKDILLGIVNSSRLIQ